MSCREGSNSVITSLVHYRVSKRGSREDDERVVKEIFHELRREGAAHFTAGGGHALGSDLHPDDRGADFDPTSPADVEEVVEFLRARASEVRNEESLKENKRQRWLEALDTAVVKARNGEGPDRATFYAWQRYQERAQAHLTALRHDNRMKLLEDSPVTHEEVVQAINYHNRLQAELEELRSSRAWHGLIGADSRGNPDEISARLNQVAEDCQTLVRAFDLTTEGQHGLANGTTDSFDEVFPAGRSERVPGSSAGSLASAPVDLVTEVHSFRNLLAKRRAHHDSGNRRALQQVERDLARTAAAVGEGVSEHPTYPIFDASTDRDLANTGTWERILAGENTPQDKDAVARGYLIVYRNRLRQREETQGLSTDAARAQFAAVQSAASSYLL